MIAQQAAKPLREVVARAGRIGEARGSD